MATSKRREAEEQLIGDYAQVFGSEAGQRVLHDLLTQARVLDTTFEDGDPYKTFWFEGRRSLALYILTRLRMNEADYRRLFLEHSLNYLPEELQNG